MTRPWIRRGKDAKAAKAYSDQRGMAAKRGIDWNFTFETWLEWWEQTGHWEDRGIGAEKYVMARKGDTGPYSPENIECITHRENGRRIWSQRDPETIAQHKQRMKEVQRPPVREETKAKISAYQQQKWSELRNDHARPSLT